MVKIKEKTNFDEIINNLTKKKDKNKDFGFKLYIGIKNCTQSEYDELMMNLSSRGYRWMYEVPSTKTDSYKVTYIVITNGMKELKYISNISKPLEYSSYYVYEIDYNNLVFDFEETTYPFNEDKLTEKSMGTNISKHIVYISGAITGTDDYLERFEKVENELKEMGYEVINPAKFNSHLPKTTTWEQYMAIDYKMLDICDTIYMLNGWENSKGANAELDYAKQNSKMVIYQLDNKNVLKLGKSLIMHKYNDDTINVKFCEFNLVLTKYDIEKIREFLK